MMKQSKSVRDLLLKNGYNKCVELVDRRVIKLNGEIKAKNGLGRDFFNKQREKLVPRWKITVWHEVARAKASYSKSAHIKPKYVGA
jgi:hypothetical protein